MMTKEEIQRSITELQYQYQALIREGSYKLAKIRKERIKKLREQLKQLNKAKVQDSMDILRLCGYNTQDAGPVKYKGYTIKKDFNGDIRVYDKAGAMLSQDFYSVAQAKAAIDKREEMVKSRSKDSAIQVGPWLIYQEGNEISVHRGGRAWAQGFKSVQEAKAWIQKKERWLETGKDGCPIFTKGTTKDKTKVVGQIGSVKIYYDDNDDIYYVNQGGSIFNNPGFKTKQEAINYVVKNNTKDDDATEHGSIEQYGKGTETESIGLSDDPVLAQDGGPGSGIKGHSTIKKLEARQDVLYGKIRKLSKYGDDYSRQMLKGYQEEYDAIHRRLASMSNKDSDPKVAERSVEDSRSDLDRKQEALEQERYKKSEILARKLNQNQITEREFDSQIRKLNEEYREKERRLLREAKDAEAQAIINLCGGIF